METLNPQQLKAVHHVDGSMLVLAGAGSGKTRVVTQRILHLLQLGILASDILAVTFTNKAAEEMKSRIRKASSSHVLACTFHSLGARILRESILHLGYTSDFTIYDEEDSEKLLRNCVEQLELSKEKSFFKELRLYISTAKNNLQDPDSVDADPLFARAYALYQSQLKACGALDFDDLLYLTVKLLSTCESVRKEYQNRWLFVLIDEYQDTNKAQHLLANILVEKHHNLFAVGDPDQSIYSWRGANYHNILNFEKDFPGGTVVTLDQNYRSTNIILQAANQLISHNSERYEKKLWSNLGEGVKIGLFVAHNERKEAEFVAEKIFSHIKESKISLDEIAVFYRTNAQSRAFEDALLLHRIPYKIIGGLSFYQRREVKDILAYLKMIVSNADLISFLRTINLPRRGLGATTLEKITNLATSKQMPVFSLCEDVSLLKLSEKQRSGLQEYTSTIRLLRGQRDSLKLHELVSLVIEQTNYLRFLKEDPETYQERRENLDELVAKAAEWEEERETNSLPQFLEELALRSGPSEQDHVATIKLMTLHNSKGLEFTLAFLVGMEEELFPHVNSLGKPEALEEERRLCYVGMTRAKRYLYLTSATYRFMWGGARVMAPSRFLREIPSEYVKQYGSYATLREAPSYERVASSSDSEEFAKGTRVYHKEFGSGVVEKSYASSLGLTYEVYFEEDRAKRSLVAKYAKLQLV